MKKFTKTNKILILLALTALVSLPLFSIAQNDSQPPTAEENLELQKQLDQIQQEIKEYEKELSSVKSEKNTLTNKINQLKIQQNKISLQIRQSSLTISEIEEQLVDTENNIKASDDKITGLDQKIASLLRQIEKKDRYSWLEIFITKESIKQFFVEVSDYNKLAVALSGAVNDVRSQKDLLELGHSSLNEKKE